MEISKPLMTAGKKKTNIFLTQTKLVRSSKPHCPHRASSSSNLEHKKFRKKKKKKPLIWVASAANIEEHRVTSSMETYSGQFRQTNHKLMSLVTSPHIAQFRQINRKLMSLVTPPSLKSRQRLRIIIIIHKNNKNPNPLISQSKSIRFSNH